VEVRINTDFNSDYGMSCFGSGGRVEEIHNV
jgi:hypothetical protein